jgi:hypothetical protein
MIILFRLRILVVYSLHSEKNTSRGGREREREGERGERGERRERGERERERELKETVRETVDREERGIPMAQSFESIHQV